MFFIIYFNLKSWVLKSNITPFGAKQVLSVSFSLKLFVFKDSSALKIRSHVLSQRSDSLCIFSIHSWASFSSFSNILISILKLVSFLFCLLEGRKRLWSNGGGYGVRLWLKNKNLRDNEFNPRIILNLIIE